MMIKLSGAGGIGKKVELISATETSHFTNIQIKSILIIQHDKYKNFPYKIDTVAKKIK